MAKFRKLPVVIEAVQWFSGEMDGVCTKNEIAFREDEPPHVHTMHNNQMVYLSPGDWVVPEPDGEHYYPIKPDIFEQTYEPVE